MLFEVKMCIPIWWKWKLLSLLMSREESKDDDDSGSEELFSIDEQRATSSKRGFPCFIANSNGQRENVSQGRHSFKLKMFFIIFVFSHFISSSLIFSLTIALLVSFIHSFIPYLRVSIECMVQLNVPIFKDWEPLLLPVVLSILFLLKC